MSERIYLDYNATSVVRPEAEAAMVAALAGARPQDVVFTSGGCRPARRW